MPRETIELLLFLKVAEATIEPAQQRFRDRISNFRGGYWCKSYASPDELVLYGLRSLMKWLCEFWAGVMEERSRRARRRQVALASFAAATVAVAVVVGLTRLRDAFTTSTLAGACFTLATVPLMCWTSLWADIGGRDERE